MGAILIAAACATHVERLPFADLGGMGLAW